MRVTIKSVFSIISSENGQSLVEYALILFFIFLVAVVALTLLGVNVAALINNFVTAAFGV
jgi:Flp pilus assembly pilin Flp